MADIKCPNCGKINPSFAENCMACQAPLTPAPSSEPQAGSEEEIPEWLKRIRERTQEEEGAKSLLVSEPSAPYSPTNLPEWLKELQEEKKSKEPQPAEEESEDVDWLEKLRTSPTYNHDHPKTGPLPETEAEAPQTPAEGEPADGTPDWLAALRDGKMAQDDFIFPKADETHPQDATSPVPVTNSQPNPFTIEPEQTRTRPENEFDSLASLAGREDGAGAWTEKTDQEPLPFTPEAAAYPPSGSEPPFGPDFFQTTALSNRIQLSEKQRLNVNLLKTIIANESEPRPVSAGAAKPWSRAAQLFIYSLILLILFGAIAAIPRPAALPQLYPIEVASLFNEVSTLPVESPVLVAVDYDPALAGEMQLASSALLGHLMTRDARLSFVSSRPTGPMLADALVSSLLPGQPQFSTVDHVVNLGYIPGDAAGLRLFARRPKDSAPYSANLQPAWSTPALKEINLLSDFSAVIVITDNADVMRTWIEQVQPALNETPLFVVLSAQIGPIIQPYMDSDQVRGGLSGISGGAMYSQILGKAGFADQQWNAFQVGAIMAVLAILGGGIFHLLAALFKKSKAEGEA